MNKIRKLDIKFLFAHPAHFFSLGFGSGLFPKAPGTAGTVVGIPVYLLLAAYLDSTQYAIATAVVIVFGFWVCGITERAIGEHDHGSIVWDEIAGYLITMFLAPTTWWSVLAGFLLFRLFDIWKPYPISWVEQRFNGGVGTMMDDVVAGLFAWLALQMILYFIG